MQNFFKAQKCPSMATYFQDSSEVLDFLQLKKTILFSAFHPVFEF